MARLTTGSPSAPRPRCRGHARTRASTVERRCTTALGSFVVQEVKPDECDPTRVDGCLISGGGACGQRLDGRPPGFGRSDPVQDDDVLQVRVLPAGLAGECDQVL